MIKHQVLTVFFAVLFDSRAQKRVAQQRIDSRIALGKLIDLRKKLFSNVKVRVPTLLHRNGLRTVFLELCKFGFTNR